MESVMLGDLVARSHDRLVARAERAGMDLVVDAPAPAAAACVRANGPAVERILLNLVDNACKYAGRAEDRSIHLHLARRGRFGVVRVRDHGPGLVGSSARRLFRPFSKSADEAADSAAGVGLGLALSRRLARDMHGDLRLDKDITDGACFELSLPACDS